MVSLKLLNTHTLPIARRLAQIKVKNTFTENHIDSNLRNTNSPVYFSLAFNINQNKSFYHQNSTKARSSSHEIFYQEKTYTYSKNLLLFVLYIPTPNQFSINFEHIRQRTSMSYEYSQVYKTDRYLVWVANTFYCHVEGIKGYSARA